MNKLGDLGVIGRDLTQIKAIDSHVGLDLSPRHLSPLGIPKPHKGTMWIKGACPLMRLASFQVNALLCKFLPDGGFLFL